MILWILDNFCQIFFQFDFTWVRMYGTLNYEQKSSHFANTLRIIWNRILKLINQLNIVLLSSYVVTHMNIEIVPKTPQIWKTYFYETVANKIVDVEAPRTILFGKSRRKKLYLTFNVSKNYLHLCIFLLVHFFGWDK